MGNPKTLCGGLLSDSVHRFFQIPCSWRQVRRFREALLYEGATLDHTAVDGADVSTTAERLAHAHIRGKYPMVMTPDAK